MSFFGKNIRKIRSIKKISQTEFANIFDLSRASVGSYEEGRAEPKIDIITKVANYFSITIDELINKELTVNELYHFDVGNEPTFKKSTYDNTQITTIPYIQSKDILNIKSIEDHSIKQSISIPLPLTTLKPIAITIQPNYFDALPNSLAGHTIIVDLDQKSAELKHYYLIKTSNAIYISKLNILANNTYHISQVDTSLLVISDSEMLFCYPILQCIGPVPAEDTNSKIETLEKQVNLLIKNTIQ